MLRPRNKTPLVYHHSGSTAICTQIPQGKPKPYSGRPNKSGATLTRPAIKMHQITLIKQFTKEIGFFVQRHAKRPAAARCEILQNVNKEIKWKYISAILKKRTLYLWEFVWYDQTNSQRWRVRFFNTFTKWRKCTFTTKMAAKTMSSHGLRILWNKTTSVVKHY